MKPLFLLATSLLSSALCLLTTLEAQPTSEQEEPAPAATPSAESADVESIDAIVAAVYDVISGEAGEARDWDRMRSLFHPTAARLMSVGKNKVGVIGVRALTPNEYIEMASPFFAEEPFFERELSRKTEQFGHIAHVFSTYESVHELDGEAFDRGINSMQLLWDENRWWMLTIYWDSESEAQPIPTRYLE